jgi:hypothetical protein
MLEDRDRAPDPMDALVADLEAARELRELRRARAAEVLGLPECPGCVARELRARIRHMNPGGRTTSDGTW